MSKCGTCGADGGTVQPTCTKPSCPNLNAIDLVAPAVIPTPLPTAEDMADPSNVLDIL